MADNATLAKNLKVVHLEAQGQKGKRARLSNLPAALSTLRDKSKLLVLQRMKLFFDKVDDSLFELADKAASSQEQNMFFDSMREIRVQRRRIEKNMALAVNNAFNDLVLSDSNREEVPVLNLTSESLFLVQSSGLEESIAIDSSISRAHSEFAESIQLISLRLDSLVQRKVHKKNNPIGPEVLCTVFLMEAKTFKLALKAKLILFKLFDRFVMAQLGHLYDAANQILVQHNVLPTLSISALRSVTRVKGNASEQDSLRAKEQVQSQSEMPTDGEALRALDDVSGAEWQSLNPGVRELLDNLSLQQKQLALNPDEAAVFDGNSLLNNIRLGQGAHSKIRRMDEEVINLVNMLFEFILRDENLAEPMKALIGRMQIPLIKVALVDKSFFARGGHVARRLLNDMANAALGWDPEEGKSDPLYSKIESVVKRLAGEFDTDVAIFDQLLQEFNSFIARDRRCAAQLERRTLNVEEGKANAETAGTVVAVEIELRTQGKGMPEVVDKIVKGVWQNVLFLIGLKHGIGSSEWRNALLTLEDLIWSAQVPESVDDRRKLIRLLPDLINRLREGMDLVAFNPFDMAELFTALETVHLNCFRGEKPSVRQSVKPVSKEGLSEANLDAGKVLPEAVVASCIDSLPADSNSLPDVEDIYLKQVNSFVQGAWFDMLDDKGTSNRCRLAAVINPTGKYIFVNRNGMKVAEKTQQELAVALKLERVRALDNSMLFDRALETVVTSLRKSR